MNETIKRIARIRKFIKARCKTISVRNGTGTAYGWLEISGSGPGGEFNDSEKETLRSLNIGFGQNFSVMDYDGQFYFLEKVMGEPSQFLKAITTEGSE
jgi:hypothetical protein